MENLLVINASPQGEASHSRQMTARFTRLWAENNPGGTVVERDLGRQPVPHVDEQWISAAFTPEKARTPDHRAALEVSDALVAELETATSIVIGCPMHNLSVPSTLKAYIDQVVRMGVTTKLVPDTPRSPYVGMLSDKPTYLMLVRGRNTTHYLLAFLVLTGFSLSVSAADKKIGVLVYDEVLTSDAVAPAEVFGVASRKAWFSDYEVVLINVERSKTVTTEEGLTLQVDANI